MRKLMWGATAACLIAGVSALVYGLWPARDVRPDTGTPAVAEREVPRRPTAPTPPSAPQELPPEIDANEPIVVEGAVSEPTPPPQIGGEALPGARFATLAPGRPRRTDDALEEMQEMPDAVDLDPAHAVAVRLWRALFRLVQVTAAPNHH